MTVPLSTRRRDVYTDATYRIPHADIQCAIDMIYIIIYIIMRGVCFLIDSLNDLQFKTCLISAM